MLVPSAIYHINLSANTILMLSMLGKPLLKTNKMVTLLQNISLSDQSLNFYSLFVLKEFDAT